MFERLSGFLMMVIGFGAAFAAGPAGADTVFGESRQMGNGTIKPYAMLEGGAPTTVGLVFTASALEGLPERPNRTSRCFDKDQDGRINDEGECDGDYELRLPMPDAVAGRADMPFQWVGMNWNPHGHPPLPYQLPHFDVHFYMVPEAEIDGIRVGPCEIFINCEDRERAAKPVPARYVHPDHVDVGAAVGTMGNHLVDVTSPELGQEDPARFTHTLIFGAYDGHITFYEPMITWEHLARRGNACHPIKQPQAWERAGHYPTVYCIRYSAEHDSFTISLEGMTMREAS